MDPLESVSRQLNNQSLVGMVGFDSSLDIVVSFDILQQVTTQYVSYRVRSPTFSTRECPYFLRNIGDGTGEGAG